LIGSQSRISWMRDLFDVSETDACETSVAIESNCRHPHNSFIVHEANRQSPACLFGEPPTKRERVALREAAHAGLLHARPADRHRHDRE
jgi:hypothetical protein